VELLEREGQLQQLSAALDGLIADGIGTCALVVGEASIERRRPSWRRMQGQSDACSFRLARY
jgi:hypothetical protein